MTGFVVEGKQGGVMMQVPRFWVTVVTSAAVATFGGAAFLNKDAFDAIPRLPLSQSSEPGDGDGADSADDQSTQASDDQVQENLTPSDGGNSFSGFASRNGDTHALSG